jgi:acetyl-CoA synthetase
MRFLPHGGTYEDICGAFRWNIPASYNMGVDVCDRHAAASNPLALIYVDGDGHTHRLGFRDIKRLSNRLANALGAHGIKPGDRVAILLPQCPEAAISHIAAYKMGAIALPLFALFGDDALQYRLGNSAAKALITDSSGLAKIERIRDRLPDLAYVIVTDGAGECGWSTVLGRGSETFAPHPTKAEDPCLLIYTSGTTGQPKGALHAHRTMLGHMPANEFLHEFYPQPGDLFWTPADWAWIGALMDLLMPAWFHGTPVLAFRAAKFDPEEAFAMMAKHSVRNAFLPPTALKLMRQVVTPKALFPGMLRTCFSGGEPMGEELLAWGREILGCTINEGYGQTECNLVVANCSTLYPVRPGSMGRAAPGHRLAIVNDDGAELPPGELGQIAVRRPDPVMMLEYWRNPDATGAKYRGDWLLTGDSGRQDDNGYFWFFGREDDVITSAGYRIGPGEIEESLMQHPAVGLAAVVGIPDKLRTEIVKAFIVLKPSIRPSDDLKADIQNHVKARLAAHEYPRLIEFIDTLPMTATGKIKRRDLRRMGDQSADSA